MKRCIAMIALILSMIPLPVAAQTQSANMVKNGDFEKFTGDTPVGWETSNIPGTLTVVSSSPLAHGGTKGMKCEVKDFYGSKIAGFAYQKNIELLGKELQLSGYYLFHSVGKDAAVVILCFQNAAGSTVGTDEQYFREEKREFTRFTKEIKAPDAASTVQVRLTILDDAEGGTLDLGSYVVFDDIKLVALPPKPKAVVRDSLAVKDN